jgi:hypothetical protein
MEVSLLSQMRTELEPMQEKLNKSLAHPLIFTVFSFFAARVWAVHVLPGGSTRYDREIV